MDNREISSRFASLSTPLLADALLRAKAPFRLGPFGVHAVNGRPRVAGRALPVRHFGSVDVFLEAFGTARAGDVLVIDNDGRTDEACIGDLTALEAHLTGLAGMLVWGCHRDTAELQPVPIAVFSLGATPAGPRRLDPATPATRVSATSSSRARTPSSRTTTGSSSSRRIGSTRSSRSPRRSPLPSGGRPTRSARASRCASSCASRSTSRRAGATRRTRSAVTSRRSAARSRCEGRLSSRQLSPVTLSEAKDLSLVE